MAFRDSELNRIRAELGMNLLTVGADVYVGVHQILEVVVQTNMAAEVTTTATLSAAISEASTPTPQTLTLASATGFSAYDRVVLDVDGRREWATIQSLSGSDIVVQLTKAHSGTIPVALEGPIEIARDALAEIAKVKGEIRTALGTGALKKVDEIEFYEAGGSTLFGNLGEQLNFWRDELASTLGVPNCWRRKQHSGGTIASY